MDQGLMVVPIARTGMLIRKPVGEVYEAFIYPAITTKFWFTKSSGRLEAGKFIRWEWEISGASTMVMVNELEPGKRILVEWDVNKQPARVEWTLTPRSPETSTSALPTLDSVGMVIRLSSRRWDQRRGSVSCWQD